MEKIVQEFIVGVDQKFSFLEEYGYKKVEAKVENEENYPDSQVVSKYIGKSIGIEVYWYFAGANMGVVFVELQNGKIPENKIFFGESNDGFRAINLYSLAGYLNREDDEAFLLQDVDNVTLPMIKKREKVIRENMSGIIDGLSRAVKKLAADIVKGDTSSFKYVMKYQNEVINKQYS